jgi:hypothetical protein
LRRSTADHSSGDPVDAAKTVAATLRPYYAGYWFGGFNGLTWMIGLGTPMVLLAEKLGATAFQVGLASSFVFLLLPVQLLATTTLERLGFKRQMVLGWSLRALFLFVPLAIVWAGPATPSPWMANALVASIFGFCFFRAFGAVAHIPWYSAFLPVHLRGRFFATDHAITSVVGVATLLSCAALFHQLPEYLAFRVLYVVAFVGSILAVWNLTRLPDVPRPRAVALRSLASEARRLGSRGGLFRHYLGLALLASFVSYSFAPFTVYYLKVERGIPAGSIMLFTAAQFAGQILGTTSIRHLIDRLPISRFFQLASGLYAAVYLFWFALVSDALPISGGELLRVALAGSYFVFGAAIAISNSTHFTYLPELSSEEARPIAVALFTAAQGLMAGLAAISWGWLLKDAGGDLGMNLAGFLMYLGVGLGLAALLIALYARLPETRLGVASSGWRRLR